MRNFNFKQFNWTDVLVLAFKEGNNKRVAYFIFGRYCMEAQLLQKNRFFFALDMFVAITACNFLSTSC